MTDHVGSGPAAVPPAGQDARRKAVREAVQSFAIGGAVSVAAMIALAILFLSGLGYLLVVVFFAAVGLFAWRIAREERAWQDRSGR